MPDSSRTRPRASDALAVDSTGFALGAAGTGSIGRQAGWCGVLHERAREEAVPSFAANPDAPAQARRWAGAAVPAHLCEAAMLAVSELVTNALVHGRLTDDEEIEIGVLPGRTRIRIWVAARGEPFTPPATTASAGAHGGWGLWLVDSVARSWGVWQQGPRTVVWFEV